MTVERNPAAIENQVEKERKSV